MVRRLLHYILSTESAAQTGAKGRQNPSTSVKTPPQAIQRVQEGKAPSSDLDRINVNSSKQISSKMPVASKIGLSELVQQQSTAKQKSASAAEKSAVLFQKALHIISEESGIITEELGDDIILSDVGIDSLLGLMIASRFRDELAMNIDATTLHGFYTIKGLKDFIFGFSDNSITNYITEGNQIPLSGAEKVYESPDDLPVITKFPDPIENKSSSQAITYFQSDCKSASSIKEGQFARVLQIISEESGIAITEFADDTVFADIGIDSLLSMMITSRLRDELDIEAGNNVNIFLTCNTLRDLRNILSTGDESKAEKTLVDITPSSDDSTNSASLDLSSLSINTVATEGEYGAFENNTDVSDTSSYSEKFVEVSSQPRRATSVILQGRPWVCSKSLFLFPDGAGSASSYANLPIIHSDLAVLALNCPYVRHPQEMTCSLEELMKSYLDEVRRRQPNGPYNLGGWSAGGILAYRATQILIQEGEEVENLLLIDSPVPKGLDRLPQRFYDHLNSINIFGRNMPGPSPCPPAHLFAHFNATIEVLHKYHAKALPPKYLKKATVVWATDCVMDGVKLPKLEPRPEDTEGMKFLTEKRVDFTAAGWEKLFPGTKVDVARVEGAHHFSMMVSTTTLRLDRIHIPTNSRSNICPKLRNFLGLFAALLVCSLPNIYLLVQVRYR